MNPLNDTGSTSHQLGINHRLLHLTMAALTPPFSAPKSPITDPSHLTFPAAVQGSRKMPLIIPERHMELFLNAELRPKKLDNLHNHLWLAGLPLPARPLQRQRMMGREIYVTELPDEHLVWHRTKLLLKPLPEFLLCHIFWVEYLCSDITLYQSAVGLLLSYVWLIGHESDFILAREAKLIPIEVDWPKWTDFVKDFLQNIDLDSLAQVDRRYHYGELRLSRLNTITRFLPSMWSYDNFIRGYLSTSTWYQAFFERNFSWLLTTFGFMSVTLSAMQVGLGTQKFSANQPFDKLSYGVTLLAIATVFLAAGAAWFVWFVLFCYHVLSTIKFDRKVRARRRSRFSTA